ncbi:MAG: YdeI/OmpD-associated family protein [Ilumatobacteraceae bacterium]
MTVTTRTFRTTLSPAGANNVAIVVPEDVVTSFGRGKRVPVVVTVDGGYQYRSTITSMDGQLLLSFNAQTRAPTGRGAGDEVEVRLDLDDVPRVVDVPPDLAVALGADDIAKAAWDKLSYSHQRAHAESITAAKAAATPRRSSSCAADLRRGCDERPPDPTLVLVNGITSVSGSCCLMGCVRCDIARSACSGAPGRHPTSAPGYSSRRSARSLPPPAEAPSPRG